MMRRNLVWAIAAVVCLGASASGLAQDKPRVWTPEHPYNITPNAGPWAICVMSYAGEKAFNLSEKFVTELRRDYRLPAYFFNRSDVERKKEEERLAENAKKRWTLYGEMARQMGQLDPKAVAPEKVWVKRIRVEDQFAVLIGGYRDMDSARRSLEHVRKLKAPSDELMNRAFVAGPANGGAEVRSAFINPFQSAFVVPNPTAPRAKPPEPDKQDLGPSIVELNADEPLSLLKCPAKWTLVVKVYRAPTIVLAQGQEKGPVQRNKGGDYISACARQAHQLAEILRGNPLNFEAYVLHAGNMSMVTVGSFNGPDDPRMEPMAKMLATLSFGTVEQLMKPPMPLKIPETSK